MIKGTNWGDIAAMSGAPMPMSGALIPTSGPMS